MRKLAKSTVLHRIKDAGKNARAGKITPFIATVSGVLSTKTNLITYCSEELDFELVTTKSFQVTPNTGNREPIICEPELGSFGNSVGLRNVGMDKAFEELKALREKVDLKAILNVSISASSAEDFISLVKKFESVADMLELNFSCPHASAGFGASIGCDQGIAAEYVRQVKEAVPNCQTPIFVKLTPNVENIGKIAKAVIDAGADGLVAINTVGPKVHIEPHAQKPILQNKLGGKGGMSGSWVFERALECVSEIRSAVGNEVPIIGMGGVSTGKQLAELVNAGADVVGIGSACGMLEQEYLKPFFDAVKIDAQSCILGKYQDTSSKFLRTKKALQYQPKTIIEKVYDSEDIIIITLNGECEFEAGEFVFLWIPGVGEKPFSLADANPLRLIIKKRGAFTEALFKLQEGDTVYMRGLYGRGVKTPPTDKALLLAGGTGIAVLPALAGKLKKQNTQIFTYIGTSGAEDLIAKNSADTEKANSIERLLISCGEYKKIADKGKIARVLDVLKEDLDNNKDLLGTDELKPESDRLACYLVGPMIFMKTASQILLDKGISTDKIFLSLEMNTMCGIGVCGECACGNILTCKQGTFVGLPYLQEQGLA